MKKHLLIAIGLFAAATLGCGDTDPNQISGYQGPNPIITPTATPTTTPTPTPVDPVANLRLVNPTEGLEDLSVSIDGAIVDADLDGLEATDYIELEPGSHTIVVMQNNEEYINETVTVGDDSFSTSVILPNNLLPLPMQMDNTADELGLDLLTVTDDVTPVAGQLNARLFNAVYFENDAELLSENEVTLLGPVEDRQATGYVTQNLANLQGTDSLLADLDIVFPAGQSGLYEFSTVQDSAQGLVDAVIGQLDTSGVNLTVILSRSINLDNAEYFLYILVDDPADGNEAVISEGTVVIL